MMCEQTAVCFTNLGFLIRPEEHGSHKRHSVFGARCWLASITDEQELPALQEQKEAKSSKALPTWWQELFPVSLSQASFSTLQTQTLWVHPVGGKPSPVPSHFPGRFHMVVAGFLKPVQGRW